MKNSNFMNLVATMQQLKETEQGKLKGGFSTIPGSKSINHKEIEASNDGCTIKNKNRGTSCTGCAA